MKRDASQSSSSGCVGGSPCRPKSPGVRTRPWPKWCIQTRLTITRAVSGLSFAGDRLGQLQPAAAFLEGLAVRLAEDGEEPARHLRRRDGRDCRGGRRAGSRGCGVSASAIGTGRRERAGIQFVDLLPDIPQRLVAVALRVEAALEQIQREHRGYVRRCSQLAPSARACFVSSSSSTFVCRFASSFSIFSFDLADRAAREQWQHPSARWTRRRRRRASSSPSRDRVELVVVAAGAGDGQAQQAAA